MIKSKTNAAGWFLVGVLLACGWQPAESEVVRADAEALAPRLELEALGRTCIALAVYEAARDLSWLEQALVARTVANAAEVADTDACRVLPDLLGYEPPYARPRSLLDWNTALAVVDAVLIGDYDIAPARCALATRFHRAEGPAAAVVGAVPPQRPLCAVGALTFSDPRPDTTPASAFLTAAAYQVIP